MVCEGTYMFPININYHYYVLQKTKSNNTFFSLRTTINGNVNIICYDSMDFLPPCLRSVSHNDCNRLPPLHIPMKEHDNVMDEKNLRGRIES